VSIRWLCFFFLLAVCMPFHSFARTVDYHIGVGMGGSKSTPPEVIDMRWARQYMDANGTGADNATQKDE